MRMRTGRFVPALTVVMMLLSGAFFIVESNTVAAAQDGNYTYTVSGGKATITGYNETGGGLISIPSTLGGYTTVAIGDHAFDTHAVLTSVTIPDSVTSIGNYAFANCHFLNSVTIPSNVTTIGNEAFDNCPYLRSVTIPSNVTTIGEGAFRPGSYHSYMSAINVSAGNLNYASINGVLYNKAMTTLIQCPGGKVGTFSIPDSVTTIGNRAFTYCQQLTSVAIPSSVTTIGNSTFYYCLWLGSVTIPSSVTSIGDYAFESCIRMTSVTIPSSVTTIGNWTFAYCQQLTSVTIPDSVTSIGNNAFYDCISLSSMTIGSGATSIGVSAFQLCSSLTSIKFLGLVAPTNVGVEWISGTPVGIIGHAYAASNFPAPGGVWNGLTMGTVNPTVPGVPTGLTATPGNAQVTLNWTAPANNGGSAITSYKLYRAVTETGTYAEIASPTGTTYTNTGLTNGQAYWYQVSAVNIAGEGSRTVQISAIPFAGPGVPTGLTAVPGNAQVTLNWTVPASNGGSAVTGYKLYRAATETGTYAEIALPTGTTYTDTGLTNGQAYWYKVSAVNTAGEGSRTVQISSVPFTVPDVPTGLTAVPGNTQVSLNWTAPAFNGGSAITSYKLYRSLTETGTYTLIASPTELTYNDVALTPGLTHWYEVSAFNAAGEGSKTTDTSSLPFTYPFAPTDLILIPGNAQMSLSWTAPTYNGGSAIDYYIIYQNGVALPDHYIGKTVVVAGLTNGQSYSFAVAAHNIAGIGVMSGTTSSIPYTVPNAPTGLTAIAINAKISLNWTAPAFNGGIAIDYYIIYQNGVALPDHPTVLSMIVTGLSYGQSYSFAVAAHNLAGIGPNLTSITVVLTQTKPTGPTNVSATTVESGIVLTWSNPANNGEFPTTYEVYRGTSSGAESPLASDSGTTYTDKAIILGTNYYYYVEAVNQLGSSTPSIEVGPISASASVALDMETDSSSSSIGILITITGEVKTLAEGMPIGGMNVDLSYSVNNGQIWIFISSVTTSSTGNFSTNWIPPATGVYTLKGSWAGNTMYQASNWTMSLAVTSPSNEQVFTVQSNSTISDLSFNSVNMELSFNVSGVPGTYGYSRIVISKQLVANGSDIKLSLDGGNMDYQLSSTDSSWILYFTYHHSTHTIVATLNEGGKEGGATGSDNALSIIAIAGVVIIATLLVAVMVMMRRRKGKE